MDKKQKEDKNKINPIAKENEGNLTLQEIEELSKSMNPTKDDNSDTQFVSEEVSSFDTFFSKIIDGLFDSANISMMTEYSDEDAIFAASKGIFLSKNCNVPIIKSFIDEYERRMVSKARQGRQEMVASLERRQEYERSQQINAGIQLGQTLNRR